MHDSSIYISIENEYTFLFIDLHETTGVETSALERFQKIMKLTEIEEAAHQWFAEECEGEHPEIKDLRDNQSNQSNQ